MSVELTTIKELEQPGAGTMLSDVDSSSQASLKISFTIEKGTDRILLFSVVTLRECVDSLPVVSSSRLLR